MQVFFMLHTEIRSVFMDRSLLTFLVMKQFRRGKKAENYFDQAFASKETLNAWTKNTQIISHNLVTLYAGQQLMQTQLSETAGRAGWLRFRGSPSVRSAYTLCKTHFMWHYTCFYSLRHFPITEIKM